MQLYSKSIRAIGLTYTLLLYVLSLIGCQQKPSGRQVGSIDIEYTVAVGMFSIQSLSNYVTAIRYVPLETHDNGLISDNIKHIVLENGKLFVQDQDPFLKVFDANTGDYLYNIGGRGQGPGELAHLTFAEINTQYQRILLNWDQFTHEFDFEGNFLGRIQHPILSDNERCFTVVMLDENLFAANVSMGPRSDVQKDAIVIFNRNGEILNRLRSHNDPIQHPEFKSWSWSTQGGIFFRSSDALLFYRSITDTIYIYNQTSQMFEMHYPLYFGKHKNPNDWRDPRAVFPDIVTIKTGDQMTDNNIIVESEKYIFFDFMMFNHAPEPFEHNFLFDGQIFTRINQDVYGIFEKASGQLSFLLQPDHGVRGLKNDIDGGVPFLPKSVSSSGELIDFHQAYKFIELVEQMPNPDMSLLRLTESIDEEDNPIVIIAIPK